MKFKTVSKQELTRLWAMSAALYEMDHGDLSPEQEVAVQEIGAIMRDMLFPGPAEVKRDDR